MEPVGLEPTISRLSGECSDLLSYDSNSPPWIRTRDLVLIRDARYQLRQRGGGRRESNPRLPGPQPGAITDIGHGRIGAGRA
jgi:hypothetical protein